MRKNPPCAADLFQPAVLLRLEGLAQLTAAVAVYAHAGFSGPVFAALFLAPDLSILAYLAGPARGRIAYNSVHNILLPLVLAVSGVLLGSPAALQIALAWLAHIGMDRMFGYGLKTAFDFKDTHLGRI
jgi:hypothetical protein